MIEYRLIRGRRDADIKALAAISALDNDDPQSLSAQM